MSLENPLGNTLHQSQHPLQHPYSICLSDITICPSAYPHFPACTLATVAFLSIFLTVDAQTTTWPPLWHPCISSQGCYVHCWNGHAGLCLPPAVTIRNVPELAGLTSP